MCLVDTLHYTSESERYVFQGWSHGPTTDCVILTDPGAYQANYRHSVLVHQESSVGEARKSFWTQVGKPAQVSVSQTVAEAENVRYSFRQWDKGETPFRPQNALAPLEPSTLTVQWTTEYLLTIEGPEEVPLLPSGWYPEGTALVLRAPDIIPGSSEGERLKFISWQIAGGAVPEEFDPESPLATVVVNAPLTLRAVYEKQYLVVAGSPFGTITREWIKEGGEVTLDAPPIEETITGRERLVFKRWEGQEGLISPRISGAVSSPIELTAIYEKQVKVDVEARHGASGAGWYSLGSTATVGVPADTHVRRIFVLKSSFAGFPGYAKGKPTIQVLVEEPTTITAVYETVVDLKVLSLILLLPLAAVIIFFANRWVWVLVRRRDIEDDYYNGDSGIGPARGSD